MSSQQAASPVENPTDGEPVNTQSYGVAESSCGGTSRLAEVVTTPEASTPDVSRAPTATDDFDTVGMLEDLQCSIQLDIRESELRLTTSFEDLIFAQVNEILAARYEGKLQSTSDELEVLRRQVHEILGLRSRHQTSQVDERLGVPQTPTHDVVGSAPSIRNPTPIVERDSRTRDTRIPTQLDTVQPRQNANYEDVITELTNYARRMRDEAEHLRSQRDGTRDPNDGFTTRTDGTHNVGPSREAGLSSHPEDFEPLHTLQKPFEQAVSYKSYRLERRHSELREGDGGRIAKRVADLRGAFPHIGNFSGRQPAKLITFLKQFGSACNDMGYYEALAVRMLSFFLEDDAHRFYTSLSSSALRRKGIVTWPNIVHQLLKRYCTEDVLSKAYEKVTRARQKETETEGEFADRIADAAIECGDVFDERTLVSYFVSGFSSTIRYSVSDSVLQAGINVDMSLARRMALAAGETFRARVNASKPTRSRSSPRAMVIGNQTGATSLDARTPVMVLPTQAYYDFDETTTDTTMNEELESHGEQRPVLANVSNMPNRYQTPDVRQTPTLTEEQARTALQMMQRNHGGVRCWGCREHGHDLYNCPYLPFSVRQLFALANYDYQAETRGPAVADSHFRIRGSHVPSQGRGSSHTRNVTFALPGQASTTRQNQQQPSRSNRDGTSRSVFLTGTTNPEQTTTSQEHPDDDTSDSSGKG